MPVILQVAAEHLSRELVRLQASLCGDLRKLGFLLGLQWNVHI
jgi:hypothetical protein